MAYGAIQVLTLLAMTAHAVFGCCSHHAHGPAWHAAETSEHREHADASAVATAPHCDGHHHRHAPAGKAAVPATGDESMPDDPCPHHHGDCDEGTCQYVTSPQPKVAGADAQSVGPALDSAIFVEAVALAFSRSRFSGHAPPDPSGGRCARSRTQVWLL